MKINHSIIFATMSRLGINHLVMSTSLHSKPHTRRNKDTHTRTYREENSHCGNIIKMKTI